MTGRLATRSEIGVLEALRWVLFTFGGYMAIGAVFAAVFVTRGVQRIDQAASGAGPAFRILIAPGAALFWPLLLRRWVTARHGGHTLELPTDDGLAEATAATAATATPAPSPSVGDDPETAR